MMKMFLYEESYLFRSFKRFVLESIKRKLLYVQSVNRKKGIPIVFYQQIVSDRYNWVLYLLSEY